MSNIQSILKQDPYYIEQRRKELQKCLDAFSKQLFRLHCYMPPPKRILDLKTGEQEVVNDEKWQQLFDKLKKQHEEYLLKTFPELYETNE